jgi:WD40 repeat protein
MFDALSGQILWVLRIDSAGSSPEDMYIRCLCFSPNGKYLATGSEDTLVRVRWSESYSFRGWKLRAITGMGRGIEKDLSYSYRA